VIQLSDGHCTNTNCKYLTAPKRNFLARKMLVIKTSVVDFTNLLQAAFALISLCQKITNTNCKALKFIFIQKSARKMLMKQIPAINIAINLRAPFLPIYF